MSFYKKGRAFEYRVRHFLEKHGVIVFRCAGSKPVDLIVFHNKKVFLIECKIGEISESELREKENLAKKIGAKLLVVHPHDYQGIIRSIIL